MRDERAFWRWAVVVLAFLAVSAWAVSRRFHYVDCGSSWTNCLVLDRWTGKVRLVPVERPSRIRSDAGGPFGPGVYVAQRPRLPRVQMPTDRLPRVQRPRLAGWAVADSEPDR